MRRDPPAALLDVDGTLVDTNYQHALAWYRALRSRDVVVPLWVIHRHIGMGSDRIVGALAGEEVEKRYGDELRQAHSAAFDELIDEISALPGATELLSTLCERGHRVVLASSAQEAEVERYLELLDAKALVAGWTTSDDVAATKPAPDLVLAALERAGGGAAVMIGDSTWDCLAARRAGIQALAVLTGGFSSEELAHAGADRVFESLDALRAALDETSLRR